MDSVAFEGGREQDEVEPAAVPTGLNRTTMGRARAQPGKGFPDRPAFQPRLPPGAKPASRDSNSASAPSRRR